MSNLDINKIRSDFPQLTTKVNDKNLVYFDNGATTLKPRCVIEAMTNYLSFEVANVHRGVHTLSEVGTRHFEETRRTIQKFINAKADYEVIFTKGTTDGLNLLASSFGEAFIKAGDEIIISEMEHHSNIVPWQMMCEKRGATLKVAQINSKGELDVNHYKSLLSNKTKLVSIVHTSNTLGTTNPVKELIKLAHEVGAKFCIDAAQSVAHTKVDVQDLDCDFLVFSAHKILGPNGFGALYGKEDLLNQMPPYQGGGAMISEVTFEKTTYNILPNKFEAGTPPIAEAIAFKSALDYIDSIGISNIEKYEHELTNYALEKLTQIQGLKLVGEARERSSVISFFIDGVHPHDLGTLLDKQGIAIRTGHHCTQPLLKKYGLTAAARVSLSFYNTKEEIDVLINGINKAKEFLL